MIPFWKCGFNGAGNNKWRGLSRKGRFMTVCLAVPGKPGSIIALNLFAEWFYIWNISICAKLFNSQGMSLVHSPLESEITNYSNNQPQKRRIQRLQIIHKFLHYELTYGVRSNLLPFCAHNSILAGLEIRQVTASDCLQLKTPHWPTICGIFLSPWFPSAAWRPWPIWKPEYSNNYPKRRLRIPSLSLTRYSMSWQPGLGFGAQPLGWLLQGVDSGWLYNLIPFSWEKPCLRPGHDNENITIPCVPEDQWHDLLNDPQQGFSGYESR